MKLKIQPVKAINVSSHQTSNVHHWHYMDRNSMVVHAPFNFDLAKMKAAVEDQEFVEVPDSAMQNREAFREWIKNA